MSNKCHNIALETRARRREANACFIHYSKHARVPFSCTFCFFAPSGRLKYYRENILDQKMAENQKEKEGEGVTENPVGEGESSPEEEKEREQLEERIQYAFETIAKEMPGAEAEYEEYYGNISVWVAYVAPDDEGVPQDRGLQVGILYLVREDPETHKYYLKSEQEILDSIKTLKSDFVFVQSQICEVMKQWRRINNESVSSDL